MNYLSIACTVRDEDDYLEEFISYHKAVGVEKFYIADNESAVPVKKLLANYIATGLVEVIDFPGTGVQQQAYRKLIEMARGKTKWLAVIDCDEFLLPKQGDDIKDILKDYEQYGGVVVNWMFIGSSGHNDRPSGLVIENYTNCSSNTWCINSHIKTICNLEHIQDVGMDAHCFNYKNGFNAVNTNKIPAAGSVSERCQYCLQTHYSQNHLGATNLAMDKLVLNHYYTKSLEEFMIRLNRGAAHLQKNEGGGRAPDAFVNVNNMCQLESKDILRFVDKTKQLIAEMKDPKMDNKSYSCAVNEGRFPEEIQVPIDPAYEDDRGSITNVWLAPAGSVTVITSKKGSSRASHYHKGDWHSSYIISGSVKYTEADIDGSNRTEQTFTAGQSFFSKPMKWHRMDFSEDTTFITMNGIVKSHENYENSVVRIEF